MLAPRRLAAMMLALLVASACANSDPITSAATGSGGASSTVSTSQGSGGSNGATTTSTSTTTGATTTATTGSGVGCGNGTVETGEECDDSNTLVGDGCDACVIECDALGLKNPTNGHCYRVFADPSTRSGASAQCDAWGGAQGLGNLVSIADAAEQTFVAAMVTDNSWIGAGDQVTEGTYTWSDGTPFGYVHWAPNEPNDTTVEDCVFMRADGTWDDHDCAQTWPAFVCERRGAGTF
jgi:cysteine-rich repeat protein